MQTFRNSVRQYSSKDLSDEQIDEALEHNDRRIDPRTLEFSKDIAQSKKYISAIQYKPYSSRYFKENIESQIDFTSFNRIFKGAYYSHKIGWRKPKLEAFSYVINKNRLNKEKTLFIDDEIENIESAQNMA